MNAVNLVSTPSTASSCNVERSYPKLLDDLGVYRGMATNLKLAYEI